MSNLVIVAIPDENDRVWKVSSEKIPHLTVLFLGESDEVANLETIVQFVEHAANTTLRRFYLPVDRRGELGNDPELGPADVLFFKKGRYDYKAVRDFRAALLQEDNIRTAYDTAEQHDGPWMPHLTLGYEKRPAKVEDKDLDRFYDVSFNKIAVWIDEYDGPEFLLKDYFDEYEALETVPMDVAMSSVNQARIALGLNVVENIEHHGVKGMRWGVRKDRNGGSGTAGALNVKSAAKQVGKAAAAAGRRIGDAGFELNLENEDSRARTQLAIDTKARQAFKRTDLPALKERHGDYGKLLNRVKKPLSKEARAYRKDARETYIKRLEDAANSMTNLSGTRQYTIRERGWELPAEGGALPKSKHVWSITSREIKHADGSEFIYEIEVIEDAEGYITDLKPIVAEKIMAQTIDLGAEFLEHYGVKGMKWGVRRERGTPGFFETKRAQAEAKARVKRTPINPRTIDTIGSSKRKQTTIAVKGGEDYPASPDALRVAGSQQKLKKSGVHALSNKELQEMAQRLNLETQVSVLMGKKIKKGPGQKFVEEQLKRAQDDPIKAFKKGKKVGKKVVNTGTTLLKARRLAGIP